MGDPRPAEASGDDDLTELLDRIPPGWSRYEVSGRSWSITRVDRAGGGVVTVYGEELGGPRRISANVWLTSAGPVLRPCEMPAEDVLAVLRALPTIRTRLGRDGDDTRRGRETG